MCKVDLAGNIGGIQGHSQGEVFPIVEYQIGHTRKPGYLRSLAPFAQGCELGAADYDIQRKNSELLKRLEKLADAACDGLTSSGGFTVCYDGTEYDADDGYMVSMEGSEQIVSPDKPYPAVYKYLFDHRGHLHSGFCIGGWVYEGRLYLDVSVWYSDYTEARNAAVNNGQIGLWDCSKKDTLFV